MFIALKTTVEHRKSGWGHCDIELLRKLSLCLKIAEIIGEHWHKISLEKWAMHLKVLKGSVLRCRTAR